MNKKLNQILYLVGFFIISIYYNLVLFAEPELNYLQDGLVFTDSIKVSPSEHFSSKSSNLYKNSLYNEVWNKPVNIRILNLNKSFSGIVSKSKGKRQKTNLKLKTKDGRTLKFKIIKSAIPPLQMPEFFRKLLQKSYIDGRFNMAFPYAQTIVASLASALDILHEHPVLCCLPDNDKLGNFREDFALKPGYLMVYLKTGKSNSPYFSRKYEVISTSNLLTDKRGNMLKNVQKEKLLMLRFLSILVGDWDRHNGQLKWVKLDHNNNLFPFSLDRDMAFFSMDGSPGQFLIKNYQNIERSILYQDIFSFNADFVNVRGLIYRSQDLDMHVLVGNPIDMWNKIKSKFKYLLSDNVLKKAVETIPEEVYPLIGNKILTALKNRRDNFDVYSQRYYNYLHH